MTSLPLNARIRQLIDETMPAADPRRHKRSRLTLSVHFVLPDGEERESVITDISPGGAFVRTRCAAVVADPISLRIEKLGHFEGVVARVDARGLGVEFSHSRSRAAHMADALTWLINGGDDSPERRRDDRFPQERSTLLVDPNGTSHRCRVLDISVSGAFVETALRPPIGSEVTLGQQFATVVRHESSGIGIRFEKTEANRSG